MFYLQAVLFRGIQGNVGLCVTFLWGHSVLARIEPCYPNRHVENFFYEVK